MVRSNIIGGFFELKKALRRQQELELAYLDADLKKAQVENKIIETEPTEVRPHLAREFAVQRAFSRLGLKTKSTQECIDMARLWAKVTEPNNVEFDSNETYNCPVCKHQHKRIEGCVE